MKNSKYLIGGILLCLVLYGKITLAEGLCKMEWFPSNIEPALTGNISYTDSNGNAGQIISDKQTHTFRPSLYKIDETSFLWNIGAGLYAQELLKCGELSITFDANAGYGKSYLIDEEAMGGSHRAGLEETSFNKYFGLNLYLPFGSFKVWN